MAIIDHVTLTVSDYARSKAFYEKALAPLGIKPMMDFGQACGFGREKPEFWLGSGPASFQKPEHLTAITPTHVAFLAKARSEVASGRGSVRLGRRALAAGCRVFPEASTPTRR